MNSGKFPVTVIQPNIFIQELLLVVRRCTTSISFSAYEGDVLLPLKSGSAFLLRTPSRLLLVTAAHVVQDYLNFKKVRSDARFQVESSAFNPELQMISLDFRSDIATFGFSEEQLARLGKTPLTCWPPILPKKGDGVLFAGFPGAERTQIKTDCFGAGMLLATGRVHSVTQEQIKTRFEHEFLVDAFGSDRLPEPGYDIGGMSGGPLLTLIDGPILHWALGGVISEGLPALDMIVARAADGITALGNIR